MKLVIMCIRIIHYARSTQEEDKHSIFVYDFKFIYIYIVNSVVF
jgi:hypothetical protein